MESLHLTTSDAVMIAANYYPADPPKRSSPNGWIVFLHMMPATKESWDPLARRLQCEGYASIAIDLRGHGASDGGPYGFKAFSEAEHLGSRRDIDAAIEFLKGIGAHEDRIVLIGASIGANLALDHIQHHRAAKKAVLISPGMDYHGIMALPLIKTLQEDRQLLFIGSRDDDHEPGNAEDIEVLSRSAPNGVQVQTALVEAGGHGTTILLGHPELIETIITFITS